jgi:nitrate/nitrite-specific signal transduction histidine kinase
MGLKIMEYRAGMIGGSIQIKNRKNGGTRVRCLCPLASQRKTAKPPAKDHDRPVPSRP